MDQKTAGACAWCGKPTEQWMRFCPHCGVPQPRGEGERGDGPAAVRAAAQSGDACEAQAEPEVRAEASTARGDWAGASASSGQEPAAPRPVCTVTSEKTATGSITVVEIYL